MAYAFAFSVLLAVGQAPSAPDAGLASRDLAAYRVARDAAGRDADAHVGLALWCEQRGLTSERLKHLALAVLYDPANAAARGLMGLVRDSRGRWIRPEQLAEEVRADAELTAALAEYNRRRAEAGRSASDHWKLACWCDEHGLEAEAKAHYTSVVRLDPARSEAWKRLGYKRVGKRWATDQQVAEAKAEREKAKAADESWGRDLASWRNRLKDRDRRAEAESRLASVTDPLAVPAVWAIFVAGRNPDLAIAIQLFGQIDSPRSSRALALMAVFADSAAIRQSAAETLRGRDGREFLDLLIGLIRDPIRYEVRPVGGPGSPGGLFVEGGQVNLERVYTVPAPFDLGAVPAGMLQADADGFAVINVAGPSSSRVVTVPEAQRMAAEESARSRQRADQVLSMFGDLAPAASGALTQAVGGLDAEAQFRNAEATRAPGANRVVIQRGSTVQIPVGRMVLESQKAAMAAQDQLRADVAAIDAQNASTFQANERVVGLLHQLTGVDHGQGREAWKAWWVDQQGYAYVPSEKPARPTVVEAIPPAYVPRPIPAAMIQGGATFQFVGHQSCFASGTPVRTLSGSKSIETIEVGDRVMTQDTATGELSLQPVLTVYHNRPAATLRIAFGGESVVATPIHRFWAAGRGWVMARDLKAGDTIRSLGGLDRVVSVAEERVQPVFNLEVASGGSFFVGEAGFLVHDNSLVRPVALPFDTPATMARADASDR